MKTTKILILSLVLILFSSCNTNKNTPATELYKKYEASYENLQKLESFTKNEYIEVSFDNNSDHLDFDIMCELKYKNKNENRPYVWSLNFSSKNGQIPIKVYYTDKNLYVNNSDSKFVMYLPEIFVDEDNISLVHDIDIDDLISATSIQEQGYEQITFLFEGIETISYLNKLVDTGISDMKILEIVPSDVTMIANINDDGYLLGKQIAFDTSISLEYKDVQYNSSIKYNASVENYNFDNTFIDDNYNNENYEQIKIKDLANFLK